jgi:hypothetical protein
MTFNMASDLTVKKTYQQVGKNDIPIACHYRRKSIGSSSSKSVARRFCAMTSMRRRTSSGNPRGRVPDLALAPARERGFAVVVFAFVIDDGFGVARAGFFTGEGSGCGKRESSALDILDACMVDSTKKMVAPCPSWQPPRVPICSSLCSLSHCGYST